MTFRATERVRVLADGRLEGGQPKERTDDFHGAILTADDATATGCRELFGS